MWTTIVHAWYMVRVDNTRTLCQGAGLRGLLSPGSDLKMMCGQCLVPIFWYVGDKLEGRMGDGEVCVVT